MFKILVTGHNGFIGRHLVNTSIEKKMVILACSRTSSLSDKYKTICIDLSDINAIKAIEKHQFDAIIHLAANGNIANCEKEPIQTTKINVDAAKFLVDLAKKRQIPFVFTSTDQVFDGKKGNYSIHDIPQPIHEYGRQKKAVEDYIQKQYPKGVIFRLSLVLGEDGGFVKFLKEQLIQKKEQTLFVDEIRNAIKIEELVPKIIKGLKLPGGIYHIGGKNSLNRYEMGVQIAKQLHLDASLIKKGFQSDVKFTYQRPKDLSMVVSKI